MAGALCASESMVARNFVPVQKNRGMVLAPFNAWGAWGLETLDPHEGAKRANAATGALDGAASAGGAGVLPRSCQPSRNMNWPCAR